MVTAPDHLRRGETFELTYTVVNEGGSTPLTQSGWNDLVYLSRDPLLDLRADRYLGQIGHQGGLAAQDSYEITREYALPPDLLGPWYVIVVTDPVRSGYGGIGGVYEGDAERNNALESPQPILIELPPPSDLLVTQITVPTTGRTGEPVQLQWTVINNSQEAVVGSWADTAYLSADAAWGLQDAALGRIPFVGRLEPGESYTSVLDTIVPPVEPGDYRVIVRTDIFNQVHEGVNEENNRTVSADAISMGVDRLELGIPLDTTLNEGQQKLYRIAVPAGQTMRIILTCDDSTATNEVYVSHETVPTSISYDVAYQGALSASQVAVVPDTEPGEYYILVNGFAVPQAETPVTLLAEVVAADGNRRHQRLRGR